jgi:glycosyltransferase involved in cell wall biosynthesis
MRISVIMASFLSMPGREKLDLKFKRAVNSFLKQTHEDKELIIVADGCEKTMQIYNENFIQYGDLIKLIPIPKQSLYSGIMRNIAFEVADGEIVTYLDADDVIGKNHLKSLSEQFDINEWDWVYGDDYMALDKEFKKLHIRVVEPRYGSIGTSSISHKHPRLLNNGEYLKFSTGYGHDFIFCLKLASLGYKFKKLEKMSEYIVCHYQGYDG